MSADMRRIIWKEEDANYGPATYVDEYLFRQWCAENGISEGDFGIPYGSKPDGMTVLGWMSREDAGKEALVRGIPFQEA